MKKNYYILSINVIMSDIYNVEGINYYEKY